MDRHLKWLRRRIIASVATQTAETFAVVAVVAFAVMQWRTNEGPLTALFGSVVVAQLVAGARIAHAMRKNPLNYVFMRHYVEQPFSYRVARFQGEDEAHPVAAKLPGFVPVATIRDSEADPEPIFDVFHDPSRLVAASVSRASGSTSLISSLVDGRLLVTDARAMPPHERLVMSLAAEDTLESVIATHRRAISARSDVVELASSAHQVVLDSLAMEYDSYLALGPALSPFLDLEPAGKSWLRLIARIKPEELVGLPARLGPDRASAPGTAKPVPAPIEVIPASEVPPVAVPDIAVPDVAEPEMVTPDVAVPDVAVPEIVAPEIAVLDIAVPEMDAPLITVPVAEIAPHPFVTLEPDHIDVATEGAPVTAEVPVVVITEEPVAPQFVGATFAETPALVFADTPAAEVPLDLAAAIASLDTVSKIDAAASPVEPEVVVPEVAAAVPAMAVAQLVELMAPAHANVQPVAAAKVVVEPVTAAQVVNQPIVPAQPVPTAVPFTQVVQQSVPTAANVPIAAAVPIAQHIGAIEQRVSPLAAAAPLPDFILQPAPTSLAEAVVAAPDTAAALTDSLSTPPNSTDHETNVDPVVVPNLSAALGLSEPLSPSRPRLSAVIRANASAPSSAKRPRRKSR